MSTSTESHISWARERKPGTPPADPSQVLQQISEDLPSLSEGDVVWMKPFKLGDKSWRKAFVTSTLDERSYTTETPDGATYHRNRQHLKKTCEPPSVQQNTSPSSPGEANQSRTCEELAPAIPDQSSASQSVQVQSPKTASTADNTTIPIQRPQRARKSPAYLNDYICGWLIDLIRFVPVPVCSCSILLFMIYKLILGLIWTKLDLCI